VPITGLTVEALGGTAKDKGKNMFVLGLIAKIFHLDVDKLKKLIGEKFAGKDVSIVNTALMGFQAGYNYPVGNFISTVYKFEHVEKKPGARDQITMDGNQALAYGLLAAVCATAQVTRSRRGRPSWRSCAASCRSTAASSCSPRTNSEPSRPRSVSR
jgi:hypothetical protein